MVGLVPLAAQNFMASQDPSFWDGDKLVVLRRNPSISFPGIVRGPEGQVLAKAPKSGPKGRLDYHDGAFYSYERLSISEPDEKGRRESTVALMRFEGGKWSTLATGKFPGAGPNMAWHLRNGNILAISVSFDVFAEGGKGFPFAILKANDKGELGIRSRMDADLEKGFFDNAKKAPYYGQLLLPFMAFNFTRANDLIVITTPYGYFWVFDGNDGRLKRVAKLYSGMKDEALTGKSDIALLPGLHGYATRPNGNILLSCRDEDAVIYGMIGRSRSTAHSEEDLKAQADLINARYPVVEWWDFNPETGTFDRELPPEGFPDRLTTEQNVLDFNWRFRPNGTIEKYSFREKMEKHGVED
jgi:hypothetical protein